MRILLIEPDAPTAQSIELMLGSELMKSITSDTGAEALSVAKLYDFDLILLALNLPDMSGYQVLRALRDRKVQTPIMVLSGLAGVQDKVKALGLGADDYLTKPFHRDELIARIYALVRRSRGIARSEVVIGDLTVDIDAKVAAVGDKALVLTGKEYAMMELMALRKGFPITKEMFLNHLYGGMDEPQLKIIDVFVCKLRRKMEAAGAQTLIETVWGRGYMLRAEPAQEAVVAPPEVAVA